MTYNIDEIEGIGPAYAEKLATAEITTTDHLLEQCCSAAGRKAIGSATGVGESLLLKWANMADMMRVNGVARQYAELLEASGVDTVKELRTRRSDNLAAKMAETNESKNLCKSVPSADTIQGWIDQAQSLEPRITH